MLAVVPADTNLIGATAGVTETVIGEFMGAVNPPCPCPLLSVCCLRASQARLRAVLRVCAPRPRRYREPPSTLHAEMCDSWGAGGVARCAGATRVRPAGVARRVIFRRSRVHISGPHVAPGVILGGSDTSGRCFVAWYGRESAVPRFIYP